MARETVLVAGVDEPIEVHLQIAAFADMTLVEILDLMAEWRKENPKTAEIHNDRVMKSRSEVFKMMRAIGVERKLHHSYRDPSLAGLFLARALGKALPWVCMLMPYCHFH